MQQIFKPKYFQGMNVSWNLNIFSGPKFYIECGKCGAGFEKKIPVTNYPRVCCDHCGAINMIPAVVE